MCRCVLLRQKQLCNFHVSLTLFPRPTGARKLQNFNSPNWGGGGVEHPPPLSFFSEMFGQLFRNFPENLGPGHRRSGHQVRSSDTTSEKCYHRVTATVVERKIWNFQDLVYYQGLTTCISWIFYIGDLRSGQYRDLPIISQWEKTQMPQILIRSVQIVQNHAQLGFCWWPRCNFAYVTPERSFEVR